MCPLYEHIQWTHDEMTFNRPSNNHDNNLIVVKVIPETPFHMFEKSSIIVKHMLNNKLLFISFITDKKEKTVKHKFVFVF